MKHSKAIKYRQHLNLLIASLNDEDALEMTELFPMWRIKTYALGDRVQYDDKLYECVQAHTSQETWAPDITPALWKRVMIEEYPEWVQPTGAQDAYRIGAKVSYDNKHWINEIDYNIYAPGVSGWSQVE